MTPFAYVSSEIKGIGVAGGAKLALTFEYNGEDKTNTNVQTLCAGLYNNTLKLIAEVSKPGTTPWPPVWEEIDLAIDVTAESEYRSIAMFIVLSDIVSSNSMIRLRYVSAS